MYWGEATNTCIHLNACYHLKLISRELKITCQGVLCNSKNKKRNKPEHDQCWRDCGHMSICPLMDIWPPFFVSVLIFFLLKNMLYVVIFNYSDMPLKILAELEILFWSEMGSLLYIWFQFQANIMNSSLIYSATCCKKPKRKKVVIYCCWFFGRIYYGIVNPNLESQSPGFRGKWEILQCVTFFPPHQSDLVCSSSGKKCQSCVWTETDPVSVWEITMVSSPGVFHIPLHCSLTLFWMWRYIFLGFLKGYNVIWPPCDFLSYVVLLWSSKASADAS